jgi:hypothetical protein
MNCFFSDPGKLFDIKEFDIYNEESLNKLEAYIKELD